MSKPHLSIVVPTLDEAATLPALLGDVARLACAHEVVVADGGSTDATRALAAAAGARVIEAPRGRGRQLRAGAAAASAPWLAFLHADVRLSAAAVAALDAVVAPRAPDAVYAFRLHIDAPGAAFRVVEAGANLRSRLLQLPYGDQGLVLPRARYEAAGGHPPIPLMEDVVLVRALARRARIRLLDASVTVSARRWLRDGVWRRSARNLVTLARWYGGADPSALAVAYERSRPKGQS
jgi:rSAM/selenodomain-associated transferase 2